MTDRYIEETIHGLTRQQRVEMARHLSVEIEVALKLPKTSDRLARLLSMWNGSGHEGRQTLAGLFMSRLAGIVVGGVETTDD